MTAHPCQDDVVVADSYCCVLCARMVMSAKPCAVTTSTARSARTAPAAFKTGSLKSASFDTARRLVVETNGQGRSIVCTDSIAFELPEDRERNVLCAAGHTGRSVVDYFRTFRPWGFICSGGGIGKNDSGVSAVKEVEADGIAGASVDALTARMGDGQSTYFDGVISACNEIDAVKGVRVGQTAREAVKHLLD